MWSFSNLFGNEDKSSEPAKAAEKNESKTTIVGSKPVQAEGKQGLLDFDNAMGTMNRALGYLGSKMLAKSETEIAVQGIFQGGKGERANLRIESGF
eukprot:309324-Amorphochlora_amoeboformis.AAC.1